MQILQTDRQPGAVEGMTASSVKPSGVMFLSAVERTNGTTINVGDIVGCDRQSIMKQSDAEGVME